MRIMIVDDNKQFRDALKHMLKKNEAHEVVAEAENGKQALELLYTIRFDLVLMDIEMPEMNGIEAAKLMLWEKPNIIFIAITMYEDKAYLTDLLGAGFKACIFKNKVFEELDKAICSVSKGELYVPANIKL